MFWMKMASPLVILMFPFFVFCVIFWIGDLTLFSWHCPYLLATSCTWRTLTFLFNLYPKVQNKLSKPICNKLFFENRYCYHKCCSSHKMDGKGFSSPKPTLNIGPAVQSLKLLHLCRKVQQAFWLLLRSCGKENASVNPIFISFFFSLILILWFHFDICRLTFKTKGWKVVQGYWIVSKKVWLWILCGWF